MDQFEDPTRNMHHSTSSNEINTRVVAPWSRATEVWRRAPDGAARVSVVTGRGAEVPASQLLAGTREFPTEVGPQISDDPAPRRAPVVVREGFMNDPAVIRRHRRTAVGVHATQPTSRPATAMHPDP